MSNTIDVTVCMSPGSRAWDESHSRRVTRRTLRLPGPLPHEVHNEAPGQGAVGLSLVLVAGSVRLAMKVRPGSLKLPAQKLRRARAAKRGPGLPSDRDSEVRLGRRDLPVGVPLSVNSRGCWAIWRPLSDTLTVARDSVQQGRRSESVFRGLCRGLRPAGPLKCTGRFSRSTGRSTQKQIYQDHWQIFKPHSPQFATSTVLM